MKGKLPGNHITNETSKRVGLRPQKETTPEKLAFHRFKQKTHGVVKYLKLKWMNPSIELRELVLERVKFRNKALLKETLIINDLEQN